MDTVAVIELETLPNTESEGGVARLRDRPAGLTFIFITLLIDVLGFGLIIPVLPKLVSTLSGGGLSQGAHVFGLLMASFGLMQFLFAPVLGSLSDRYGRRPILLVSLFFTSIDYVIMALAPTIGWLFLGRIMAGITGASFTAASAYIADVSPPEKRAQNFGIIGAAFGTGFVIGPALGGLLGSISPHAPFWAAAGVSLLNCLYGLFILPESLSQENRRAFTLKSANPVGVFTILSRHGWVVLMAASLMVLGLGQQALQSTWVLYTTFRFHWNALDNGLTLALLGLASVGVNVGLLRIAVPALGEKRAILVGLLINCVGFLGFALSTHGWMMIAVMLFWSLSFISGPATQSMISTDFGPDEQGAVQGALAGLQSLTGVVGPIFATFIFGYFTSKAAPALVPGAPFFFGAALSLIALVLTRNALRRRERLPIRPML